jgi:alpha-tubulin suppressor-like RCC1 family protein
LVAADLDHDGRTDLVAPYGGMQVGVLTQQADGSLSLPWQLPVPYPGAAATTTGDINGDGLPDILLADIQNGLVVLRSTTELRPWGLGNYGQLGSGPAGVGTGVTTPSTPVLGDVASVVAGGYHNLALGRDGTVRAWGLNHVGQLGTGSTVDRSSPTLVPGLSHVTAIGAGSFHSLAVTDDGSVWTWGWNQYGQLGDGTTTTRAVPVRVPGLRDVVAVAAGITHSLAVTRSGEVWAWGLNHVGQLGAGTNVASSVPVRIAAPTGVVAVAAGLFHSLALTADGRVWSWGYNAFGQLGTASPAPWDLVPRPIPSLANVAQIAAGAYHSLALSRFGGLQAWGLNHVGQLGTADTMNTGVPTAVRGRGGSEYFLPDSVAIAAGGYHSLAVGKDGRTTAWGWNYFGQLGTGTTVDRTQPTSVPALAPGLLAAGLAHTLAVTARGA